MKSVQFPLRYVPKNVTMNDKKKQINMLLKSKKMYKKHQYFDREKVYSYKSTESKHIKKARAIYKIENIKPTRERATKTGCSLSALNQIVKKGEGAYYSSGSRPNQTAQSWGLARLASSLTAGKAAAVDYTILQKGCDPHKKAFKLAEQSRKQYKYGRSKTKKTIFSFL